MVRHLRLFAAILLVLYVCALVVLFVNQLTFVYALDRATAGGGFALASRVEDLAEYYAAVDGHPRLRVCLDTCHAHAAGHDLSEPGGLTKTLDTLVDTVLDGVRKR